MVKLVLLVSQLQRYQHERHEAELAGEEFIDEGLPRELCPYCATDRAQWYTERREKARTNR